jgi:tRNA pseudouridine55 synthase
LVDKPAGVTSHDVVNAARRAVGEKRIGHAGTLDPFATGLLVLLVGRATRLLQYVHDEPKVYDATVAFGAETDTEDLGGAVVREAPRPTRAALLEAASRFVGTIEQVPPQYSAKRVDGQRAYALARAGVEVELKPVTITVHELTLSDFVEEGGVVTACRMRVACGGGTYIRSLARDLARAVGSAAHLTALRRTGAGDFSVDRAIPYEQLRAGVAPLAPTLTALRGYAVQRLLPDEAARIVRGIDVEARVAGEFAALVDGGDDASGHATIDAGDGAARQTTIDAGNDATMGTLVAFAQRRPSERGDRFQPRVVMRDAV